jgi:hypothetical protein
MSSGIHAPENATTTARHRQIHCIDFRNEVLVELGSTFPANCQAISGGCVAGEQPCTFSGPLIDSDSALSSKSAEAAHFTGDTRLQRDVVPGAGHVVNPPRRGPAQFARDHDRLAPHVAGARGPAG